MLGAIGYEHAEGQELPKPVTLTCELAAAVYETCARASFLVDENGIGRSVLRLQKPLGCKGLALIFLSRLFPTLNTHDG